jgi:hypothetical protein
MFAISARWNQVLLGSLGVCLAIETASAQIQATESDPMQRPSTRGPDDLDPPPRVRTPVIAPRPVRETISRHYVEGTMGFLAGGRRYADSTFESQSGTAASLVDPFLRYPFDGINAFGLRYELRATVLFVRMTIGVDIPFPSFRTRDTQDRYLLDGMMRTVTVQSVRPYELRFGIGGEYPVWLFAPFVDLIGSAYWTNAGLSVDDTKADFQAQGFSFALRAGTRIHLKPWFFVQVSGEIGLYGALAWNSELSLGFALGTKDRRD